jgi:hypothetical protein
MGDDRESDAPADHGDESAADQGFRLADAFAQAAADQERMMWPAIDQLGGLLPLIEAVNSRVRQMQQAAEVVNWVRPEDLRTARSLAGVVKTLEESRMAVAKLGGANLIAANLRGLDQLTAVSELYRQHSATAVWAEKTLGFTAITNWRVALQASSRIEQFHTSMAGAVQAYQAQHSELLRISHIYTGLTDWIVQRDVTSRLLGELSGKPLARWRDFIGTLPLEPAPWELQASVLSGYSGLGILGTDLLTTGAGDAGLVEAGSARIEADVLEPWEEGRLDVGRALRKRLGEIDPSVPELLEGAWHELKRPSPAAVSKMANCAIEVLDRTLRAAAPEAAVREWHQRSGRHAAEWEEQQRPPQSLRIRFLAQQLGGAEKLAVAQYESLVRLPQVLRKALEASKHASRGDLVTVRSHLLAIEDLLAMLLLSAKDDENGPG